jgi:hypothetical protein
VSFEAVDWVALEYYLMMRSFEDESPQKRSDQKQSGVGAVEREAHAEQVAVSQADAEILMS